MAVSWVGRGSEMCGEWQDCAVCRKTSAHPTPLICPYLHAAEPSLAITWAGVSLLRHRYIALQVWIADWLYV